MSRLRRFRSGTAFAAMLFCGLLTACANPPTAGFVGTNPTPSAQVGEAFRLSFSPPGVMTGRTSVGNAMLTLPASSGGTVVTLSSSNPVAIMPSSVTVPPGAQSVDFPVSSGLVSVDTDVAIRMSTPNRSTSTTFSVWAVLPNFFSFVSDPGDPIGGGQYGRLTPPASPVSLSCNGNEAIVSVFSPQRFGATFSAPAGQPLSVGTYENTISSFDPQNTRPGLFIFVNNSCAGTGRFVVNEVSVSSQGSTTFWATYEERCNGYVGGIRGDVRVTTLPGTSSALTTCLH